MGHGFDRASNLRRLADERFDVLVVGGGIGPRRRARRGLAGLRTALVERDDFASGTSSKSSKLVHGGLRYLQNATSASCTSVGGAAALRKNAPHLVKSSPSSSPSSRRTG